MGQYDLLSPGVSPKRYAPEDETLLVGNSALLRQGLLLHAEWPLSSRSTTDSAHGSE
jgi:hypothetical protein